MDTPADRKNASYDIGRILSQVESTIGSLSTPNYGRVKQDAQRYARLVRSLSGKFWVRDTSDNNTDLASVFELRHILSDEEYVLYVSNVANFTFTMKLDDVTVDNDPAISDITKIVSSFGLTLLDRRILATPVTALTFYASQPTLFNILFSDMDFLPWQSISTTRS